MYVRKKLHGLMAAVLALMMCVAMLSTSAFAAETDTTDWTADSESKTVAIYTADGLRAWADSITTNRTDYSGYTINIMADIDLGDQEWVPIRAGGTSTTGASVTSLLGGYDVDGDGSVDGTVINGNGHTISNMYVSRTVDEEKQPYGSGFIGNVGMYAELTVKNITFTNAHVDDSEGDSTNSTDGTPAHNEHYAGVVVGHGCYDGLGSNSNPTFVFENVTVKNSVVTCSWQCGGIIGYSNGNSDDTYSMTFTNCSVIDTFVGGYNATAGALTFGGINKILVQNCIVDGVRLYSDSSYPNATTPANNLFVGHVYSGSYTEAGENTATDSYFVIPTFFVYANGITVKEYVKVATELTGWYSDEDCTTAVTQIDGTTYVSLYGTQSLVNDETYETQNTTLVANPLTHGAIVLYTTEAYQKESHPGLDKVIVLEDGTEVEQDNVAAGDTVSYKLTSNVPSTLSNYIDYSAAEGSDNTNVIPLGEVGTDEDGETYTYTLTFHDQMDSALTYNNDLKVYIGDTLLENTDEMTYYTVTTSDLEDGCTFEVSIDLLALYAAGIITEDDFGVTSITVTFSATLSEDATAGAYYNTAWVAYPDGQSKEDTVEVDTYKLSVFKYDQADSTTGLAGAIFTVYSDEACTEIITTIESGSDGYAALDGLDAGTYYLKETEAPEGYVKADTVLTVTIPADVTDYVASVSFANAAIPSTGGMGTTMYTVAGVCIILAAGLALVVTRKKHEA